MAIAIDRFVEQRPFLYHLTSQTNVGSIRATRVLESAERLFRAAGRSDLLKTRRREGLEVAIGTTTVHIRDQSPLHAGNMRLETGWTLDDFVLHLNEHVFFWPGRDGGPISYGLRHYQRYELDQPVMLRIPTGALLRTNPSTVPLFCKYNSGSPRCHQGRKSPRTRRTFLPADAAEFGVTQVVEVTFPGAVRLPRETEFGPTPIGPWESL
jgi:hypothetical protein